MKLFGKKNKVEVNNVSTTVPQEVRQDDNLNKKKSINATGYEYRLPEIYGIQLTDWKLAVQEAWSETNPNRVFLSDIYKAILTYDSQTIACVNQRKLFSMGGEMDIFNEDGSINEEANKVIKNNAGTAKEWFRNYISYTLDSIFWGHSLIMLDITNDYIDVKKMPARNVVPNLGYILKDTISGNSENNRIYFNDPKYKTAFCSVSYTNDLNDLGLLSACAPYFFSKVTGNWKAHADKFGMLTRVLKTDSENRDKMMSGYNALKNQVRANFLVIGKDEELTFEGDSRSDIAIYQNLNEYCDKAISKIILGQTATTDEKSYTGASGVQKEILDAIIRADKEFVASSVNKILIPKLQALGYLPTGIHFGMSTFVNDNQSDALNKVKTLYDMGYSVDPSYIEKTFNVKLNSQPKNNNL